MSQKTLRSRPGLQRERRWMANLILCNVRFALMLMLKSYRLTQLQRSGTETAEEAGPTGAQKCLPSPFATDAGHPTRSADNCTARVVDEGQRHVYHPSDRPYECPWYASSSSPIFDSPVINAKSGTQYVRKHAHDFDVDATDDGYVCCNASKYDGRDRDSSWEHRAPTRECRSRSVPWTWTSCCATSGTIHYAKSGTILSTVDILLNGSSTIYSTTGAT